MTTNVFEKSMSMVTGKNGQPKALLFDITNNIVREYFEDLLDTMEAEQRMNVENGRPFADFKKEYLANRK